MAAFPKLPSCPFRERSIYFLEGVGVGVSNQGGAAQRCRCHTAGVFCAEGGGRGGWAAPARLGESLQ